MWTGIAPVATKHLRMFCVCPIRVQNKFINLGDHLIEGHTNNSMGAPYRRQDTRCEWPTTDKACIHLIHLVWLVR